MSDIFQAAEEGNLARVQQLLAQGGLDLAAFELDGEFNFTALSLAAKNGRLDVAEALIRAGAPLNVPGEDWPPLHGAVMHSHYDLAAMLLREGAEVDALAIYFGTPLSWAEDRPIAALLIAARADVNRGGLFSPLHMAAINGNLAVMEVLLSHPDISINKPDGQHRIPLHEAARFHRTECVAALLAAGADAYYSEFRIIAMLVAAGDRQWDCIPSPCPGLESTLSSVWKEAPQELPQLFSHLEPEVKRRIRTALCTLHHASPRHLPDHIRMRLLDEAFKE